MTKLPNNTKIGITATRQGLTVEQIFKLGVLLNEQNPEELHHGDCVGGDATAHGIAHGQRVSIVIHPPKLSKHRAFCAGAKEVREPLGYLERNHNIVDETDLLIALPRNSVEELRSGTWATIRYAQKRGKTVVIIPGEA